MTAAAFVLLINLFVAAIFAVAFGVIAAYQKRSDAALWLAGAYAFGVLNVLLEFVLPHQADPRPVGMAIFLVFLLCLVMMIIGLARHYRMPIPKRSLATLVVASGVLIVTIIDSPRTSFARGMFYQAPYAIGAFMAAWVILKCRPVRTLDAVLSGLFILAALTFLAKPLLANAIGSGEMPQTYMTSQYAAYSQAAASVLLVAIGLMLVLIQVRDLMDEMTARSQTDRLSGLLNRRGFEERVEPALASLRRSGLPGSIIIADLDHFKTINDTHGHEAGDRVIAAFASVLAEAAGPYFVSGRLGGEEFVVFLPGVEATGARLFAESVRQGLAAAQFPELEHQPTVSIGVAQIESADSQADALRRADRALYEAKRGGRDRVQVAPRDTDAMPVHPLRVVTPARGTAG